MPRPKVLGDVWKGYHGGPERLDDDVETGVAQPRLTSLLQRLTELPDDFHLHRKLKRMLEGRRQMAAGRAAAGLVGGRGLGLRQPGRWTATASA